MDNYRFPAITVNTLAEGSRIGVSCSIAPEQDEPVVLIRNVSGYKGCFVSDKDSYINQLFDHDVLFCDCPGKVDKSLAEK